MIDFEWRTNPELMAELKALDSAMQAKAIDFLLKRTVAPALKLAKTTAPTKSGALKRSLGRKKLNRKERNQQGISPTQAAIGVGATRRVVDAIILSGGKIIRKRRSQAYKLRFFEEGTKSHSMYRETKGEGTFFVPMKNKKIGKWINRKTKVKNRKVLKFSDRYSMGASHPGTRANPFLTRAWQTYEPQMPDIFMTELEKWVQKNAPRQFNQSS